MPNSLTSDTVAAWVQRAKTVKTEAAKRMAIYHKGYFSVVTETEETLADAVLALGAEWENRKKSMSMGEHRDDFWRACELCGTRLYDGWTRTLGECDLCPTCAEGAEKHVHEWDAEGSCKEPLCDARKEMP